MRSPIYLDLKVHSLHETNLTAYEQHTLNAHSVLLLLRNLGHLYAALPEEIGSTGVSGLRESETAYRNLCDALAGLGMLQAALADFAHCEVQLLAEGHAALRKTAAKS